MQKAQFFTLFSLLIIFCFCSETTAQGSYEIVVSTDFNGNVVDGSIETLIEEIRKGKPVRVGWQLDFNDDNEPDFDHWIDAEFITILGDHVFTQIEDIYMQGPNMDIPQVQIYPVNRQWTGILGTNSKLLNRYVMEKLEYEVDDEGNPIVDEKVEKGLAQREVRTWDVATFWSVQK